MVIVPIFPELGAGYSICYMERGRNKDWQDIQDSTNKPCLSGQVRNGSRGALPRARKAVETELDPTEISFPEGYTKESVLFPCVFDAIALVADGKL